MLVAASSHRNFLLALALVALLAAGASAQEYIGAYGPGPTLSLNLSGGIRSRDSVAAFRDGTKTWGMYGIALTQAAWGHWQDAKHTLWQIDQRPPCCPAEVTGVWFCCGRPIYDRPPMPAVCTVQRAYVRPATVSENAARVEPAAFIAPTAQRKPDHVPATAPAGLPAAYLSADPRHGAVVDFTDERDARGTRITSRKYADGYVVIETPRAAGVASR